jgi:hypothetical protein
MGTAGGLPARSDISMSWVPFPRPVFESQKPHIAAAKAASKKHSTNRNLTHLYGDIRVRRFFGIIHRLVKLYN